MLASGRSLDTGYIERARWCGSIMGAQRPTGAPRRAVSRLVLINCEHSHFECIT